MDWFLWAPVLARVATVAELRETWTLDDLHDYHEASDVMAAIKSDAIDEAQRQAQQRR